jgi:hypothetical protein
MPTAGTPLKSAIVRGSSPPRELLEIAGALEPAAQANGALVVSAGYPAHRRGQVLRAERLHHLRDRDIAPGERGGVELDGELALDTAHDLDVGDAGDAPENAGDLGIRELGQRRGRQRLRREGHRYDRQVVRIEAGQHRLFHFDRQVATYLGDTVAGVLGRLLQVGLEGELDGDQREPIHRRRPDLVDAADRSERLLEPVDELTLDHLRRGSRVGNGDGDDRRVDLGELVGIEREEREEPEDDERQHGGDGDDRVTNREIRYPHGPLLAAAVRAGASRPASAPGASGPRR